MVPDFSLAESLPGKSFFFLFGSAILKDMRAPSSGLCLLMFYSINTQKRDCLILAVFWGISIVFPIATAPVCKGSSFSTASPTCAVFWFFNKIHFNRCEMISIVALICNPLMLSIYPYTCWPHLTPYIIINSKNLNIKTWNLNIRPETVNLLDENTGENLQDLDIGNDFTDMTPKAQATKAKLDEWDYTKLNSFYSLHSNAYNGKSKHQPTEWEKTFVSHTSDNGLWPCDL